MFFESYGASPVGFHGHDGLADMVGTSRDGSGFGGAWSPLPLGIDQWHHAPVLPLRLIEPTPGEYSLLLDAGTTRVDDVIEELGHEPNGYFWEGVAQVLVGTEAPALEGRFSYDPEGDMFCAYGKDRGALEELGTLMATVATDADRTRRLVATAEANGFEFDD
ncbi:immunity 51 family protein [Nonomuraea wenchangensis]|uniref:immunity 51 family protein n=1 Tax=Nonomuraea wenchangensis TaxID=568860 RepID=UPI0037A36C4B